MAILKTASSSSPKPTNADVDREEIQAQQSPAAAQAFPQPSIVSESSASQGHHSQEPLVSFLTTEEENESQSNSVPKATLANDNTAKTTQTSAASSSFGPNTNNSSQLSSEGIANVDNGPKQLIVNYISPQVTELELKALFEEFGPVECARIIYDKHTGATKGFGFVYYHCSEHAAKALKYLQGFELYGKYLRIGYAVPQRPSGSLSGSSVGGGSGSNGSDLSCKGGSAQSQQLNALLNNPGMSFPQRSNAH